MHRPHHVPFVLAVALALATTGALEVRAVPVAASTSVCPTAMTSHGPLDCTRLPLGDRRFSTVAPQRGEIFLCRTPWRHHPVVSEAPWLHGRTWNANEKLAVNGDVAWHGTFSARLHGNTRTIRADGVPTVATTGNFPIAPDDPAFAYDRNPNAIASYAIDLTLPANPQAAASPGCLHGGPIGITATGVAIYDAFDAAGYDGVAHELQDACHGHPDRSHTYHYHGWLQACVPDRGSPTHDSSLLGYALDGYGIYGPWYHGKILTSADLDACHGITSPVRWNGRVVNVYHYVSTYDFPYTLGCFKGEVNE